MPPVASEQPSQQQHPASFKHSLWEWTKVIVIALVISLPIRYFIAEPFVVNGASMDPTFSTGQFLIVDRLTYDFKKPNRGDVIIFEYPNDPSVYYIKRVIGLPGETVKLCAGKVFVATSTGKTVATAACPSPEGFLGLDEPYIATDHASFDDFEITLGPTQYFVMGDNRAQSSDSRVWGPLDDKFIIGRPIIRLWPTGVLPGQYHEVN